jgi:hypothetical protein
MTVQQAGKVWGLFFSAPLPRNEFDQFDCPWTGSIFMMVAYVGAENRCLFYTAENIANNVNTLRWNDLCCSYDGIFKRAPVGCRKHFLSGQ